MNTSAPQEDLPPQPPPLREARIVRFFAFFGFAVAVVSFGWVLVAWITDGQGFFPSVGVGVFAALIGGGFVFAAPVFFLWSFGFIGETFAESIARGTRPPRPVGVGVLREPIPQHVKDQVWRRDQGRCAQCGSNYRLEFDHIQPVIAGGRSTYRNLQLLCERCNREKGAAW